MFFTSFPSLLAQKCTKTNLEQSFIFSCSSVPWHQAVLGHSDTLEKGSNLVFTSNLGSLYRKVTSSSFEPLWVQMIVIRYKTGKILRKLRGLYFFSPKWGHKLSSSSDPLSFWPCNVQFVNCWFLQRSPFQLFLLLLRFMPCSVLYLFILFIFLFKIKKYRNIFKYSLNIEHQTAFFCPSHPLLFFLNVWSTQVWLDSSHKVSRCWWLLMLLFLYNIYLKEASTNSESGAFFRWDAIITQNTCKFWAHLQNKINKNDEDDKWSNLWGILQCSRCMSNGDRKHLHTCSVLDVPL